MPNFINLHAHSKYSDGHNTLEENVFAQKKIGMTACVLTDHVYPEGYDFSLNTEKFQRQCDEATILQDQLGMPIILGVEVSVMKMEEIVVFGREAIFEILRIKSKGQIDHVDLVRIKKEYNCIMNYCHPMNPTSFIAAGCLDFLDGIEFIHASNHTFGEPGMKHLQWPEEMNGILKLCNSDAHDNDMLEWCFNDAEEPITSEEQLIKYVKDRREFKHVIWMDRVKRSMLK